MNQSSRKLGRGTCIAYGTVFAALILLPLFAAWLFKLDRVITEKIESHHWSVPAKVYARPLELFEGRQITAIQLTTELQLLGYAERGLEAPGNYTSNIEDGLHTINLFTRAFAFSDGEERATRVSLVIQQDAIKELTLDGDSGKLLRLEPLLIGTIHPTQHEDRELVALEDLPAGFIETLVNVEDRRFFSHRGVSLKGILRAAWVNSRTGTRTQGASTLTQQLIKNLFLSSEKTYHRKIKEAFMALLLEWRYSKEQILELFINEVFLAQDGNRAIHGFGLASRFFFERPIIELDVPQFSLLIGMIKAPSAYNPLRNPQRATQRRNLVLQIMHQSDALDKDKADEYQTRGLELAADSPVSASNPAYLDMVHRQLTAEYSMDDLEAGGLHIFTHYDPLVQLSVDAAVDKFLRNFDLNHEELGKEFLQTAVLISDPETGEVKAIRGGRNTRILGFNRALDAERPVGSILKPAIYLSAWEKPEFYGLGNIIEDTALSLPLPNGNVWEPKNYDNKEHGNVMMIDALSRSLNLATTRLGLELGVAAVIDTLKRLGIEKLLPEIPALLLGATELSPFDILRIYQSISSDGYRMPLRSINEVIDSQGQTLSQYNLEIDSAFDSESMYLLKYAMVNTMVLGTGRSAYNKLDSNFYVAGKTGTSDGLRDSWFAGFSEDFLGVVWLGNDNNLPTTLSGSSGALKIWTDIFKDIAKQPLNLQAPEGITTVAIDPENGKLTRGNCKGAALLPYRRGFEPVDRVSCSGRGSKINRWFKSLLD